MLKANRIAKVRTNLSSPYPSFFESKTLAVQHFLLDDCKMYEENSKLYTIKIMQIKACNLFKVQTKF